MKKLMMLLVLIGIARSGHTEGYYYDGSKYIRSIELSEPLMSQFKNFLLAEGLVERDVYRKDPIPGIHRHDRVAVRDLSRKINQNPRLVDLFTPRDCANFIGTIYSAEAPLASERMLYESCLTKALAAKDLQSCTTIVGLGQPGGKNMSRDWAEASCASRLIKASVATAHDGIKLCHNYLSLGSTDANHSYKSYPVLKSAESCFNQATITLKNWCDTVVEKMEIPKLPSCS